jgi:predicted nucleic acid-binding protein
VEVVTRYLVDKSALARMTDERVRRRLAPIIETGDAATCSIVDLEVLYSARNHEDHEAIRARRLLAYERIPLTQEIFDRAVEVQSALARRGQHRLPIPDLIVAATAEAARLTVLHYDEHFERIAAVTGQPEEWVVKRGTV